MSLTKTSKAYSDVHANMKGLLEGLVVSIDPSVGSSSSMPGWAVYRIGQLIDSGTFDLPVRGSLPERLGKLHYHMRKLYNMYPPDVLVYEEIPVQRYGGGSATAQASLLKALGAILSVPGPTGYVGLMPVSWKAMARPEYEKGDEADAIEIGWVAIESAAQIKYHMENSRRKK